MARIICPNCGEVIEVDPSRVEDLTRQLRDELFEHDLQARLAEVGHRHEAQLETARSEERREADRRVAELNDQLKSAQHQAELDIAHERAVADEHAAQLKAQVEAAVREGELAAERVRAEAAEQRAQLERKLDEERMRAREQAAQASDAAKAAEAHLSGEVTRLQAQLAAQEQTLRAQNEAELLKVTADLQRDKSNLEAQLNVERANSEQAQATLRAEMSRRENELNQRAEERLKAKDEQIEQYKDDLQRLRDYRISLSTKLIGESLEHHCEDEFNRIRMQAYPRATFEKDNTVVEGTKGDFVFRDYDEDGNELLSIMFEMKNEEELSSKRKRNEDHFKKLDSDRTKKNCEYAVLVSTLEPGNEFYNAGIADVSWRYPKMFVVRPQCFITIIGLLKAAALTAHPYRMQLERIKREELDVTTFEDKVSTLVGGIENDYKLASKNYEQASKDIDAIIDKLKHLQAQLGTAAKHLGTASNRGKKLTVKRLTWGNQTMKAAFAEAVAERAAQAVETEGEVEPIETDEGIEPDDWE